MARTFIIKTKYTADGKDVLKTQTKMQKGFGRFAAGMADKNSMIGKSFGRMNQTINKVAAVGFLALISMIGLATKEYIKFESAMAKVETIADKTTLSFENQRSQILKLSNELGLDALTLAEAQYQAISAGVTDSAEALKFVATSSKAAIGGFTDTTTAVDGLTSVLNAYGLATKDAQKISDQMLATQNFGKTTFGDMAQSMGGTIPIAAALGVQTEQLFGAIAALTKVGVQTPEAFVGVKAALSNIIKPSDQASKLAKQLGLDFTSTALKAKGFEQFLTDAAIATGGSSEKMAQLFGSVRALNTVLALTKDGSKVFKEAIEVVQDSTGATDKAFEQMTNTLGFRFDKVKVRITNAFIAIGEAITPLVENLLDQFDKIDLDALILQIQNIDMEPIMEFSNAIIGLFTFIANSWKNLISFAAAIKGVSIALGILTIATKVFGVALAATPVGFIIAAVGIIIGLFTKLALESGGVKNAFILIGRTIMAVLLSPINLLIGAYINLLQLMSLLPGKAGNAFGTMAADAAAMQDKMNKALTGSDSSLTIGTDIGTPNIGTPQTPTPNTPPGEIIASSLDINIRNSAGENAEIKRSRNTPQGTNIHFKPAFSL